MQVGNRVYFNSRTGNPIFIAGEIDDDAPRDADEIIEFIDVDYGSIDYSKNMIVGVDIVTKELILESIGETDEQKRIRELEDAILMQADTENGGVL